MGDEQYIREFLADNPDEADEVNFLNESKHYSITNPQSKGIACCESLKEISI